MPSTLVEQAAPYKIKLLENNLGELENKISAHLSVLIGIDACEAAHETVALTIAYDGIDDRRLGARRHMNTMQCVTTTVAQINALHVERSPLRCTSSSLFR